MTKQLLLYLPVIHDGYERLLRRHIDAKDVLLLGRSLSSDFKALKKEIRALDPEQARRYVESSHSFRSVRVVELTELANVVNADILVVPDEKIMHEVVRNYGIDTKATRVRYDQTFLRWDRQWSRPGRPADFNGLVTERDFAVSFGIAALDEAGYSSDWWRQVGAVAARDGQAISLAHNGHWPTEYSPYMLGDPRNYYSRGKRIELSTAMHAEAAIIARSARDGISLAGADLYVSTFPCPSCARLVAEAAFKRCFFAGPYSMLDGDQVLRQAGVEVYLIDPGALNRARNQQLSLFAEDDY